MELWRQEKAYCENRFKTVFDEDTATSILFSLALPAVQSHAHLTADKYVTDTDIRKIIVDFFESPGKGLPATASDPKKWDKDGMDVDTITKIIQGALTSKGCASWRSNGKNSKGEGKGKSSKGKGKGKDKGEAKNQQQNHHQPKKGQQQQQH